MELAGNTFFFPWEVRMMEWLQAHMGAGGIGLVSHLSMFGEELFMILVIGILYWGLDKRFGRYVGLNILMGNVWNPMVKNVFLRRRPYFDHESIRLFRKVDASADIHDISAQGYSFPSGHSTGSFSLFGSMAAYTKKKVFLFLACLFPLLVGFSRVAVGAHYPTDVLVGWAVGALAIVIVPWLERKIHSRALFYGVLLLTALPGLFYCRSADYFTCLGLLVGFIAGAVLEEKKVRFENTRSIPRIALRVAGGLAVFFALNTLLKLPFSADFLSSGSTGALLVRCARYAVVSFVEFGVYPIAFRYAARLGAKKAA